MNGYGEYYNKELDELYIGFFKDNIKNGFGILWSYKNNFLYLGEYKFGKKEGLFRIFKKDKESFIRFRNDLEILDEKKNEKNNYIYKLDEEIKSKMPYIDKSLNELKEKFNIKRIKSI